MWQISLVFKRSQVAVCFCFFSETVWLASADKGLRLTLKRGLLWTAILWFLQMPMRSAQECKMRCHGYICTLLTFTSWAYFTKFNQVPFPLSASLLPAHSLTSTHPIKSNLSGAEFVFSSIFIHIFHWLSSVDERFSVGSRGFCWQEARASF